MKPKIHPEYKDVKVSCSCGSVFVTRSTMGKETLSLEVCSKCHPFYTGTQKIVDAAGRVDRFRQKYGRKGAKAAEPAKAEEKVAEKPAEKKAEPAPKAEKKAAPAKAEKKAKPAAKAEKKADKKDDKK